MKRDEKIVTGAVFGAVLLLYLSQPSSFFNFDGVACAIAVELGDLRNLAHGNHVAYGLVALAFDRLWRLAGYAGPAILPMNVLSSLLGAASCAVFYSTLRRLQVTRALSVCAAVGLAVSQAFWFWHLEAQVYPLGVFFLALAAREALAERPRPAVLGLLQAGAVLGHVGHVMLAPAALYSLRKKKDRLTYLMVLGAAVAAAYALAVILCLKPRSAGELRVWLLGSAALKVDKSFTWYGRYSFADLSEWLKMGARVFAEPASGPFGAILACAALASAWVGRRERTVRFALLWLAGYALLFMTWEPFMAVYRIGDLLALWLLIALLYQRKPSLAPSLAVAVAALASYNLVTLIRPRADPANNTAYQETLIIARETPENAWVVVTGMGQVYVPYFAHRRPINLRYFETRLEELPARLDAAREPVFVTSTTLDAGPWREALERYGLVDKARDGWTRLYAVIRKESRGAKAGRN